MHGTLLNSPASGARLDHLMLTYRRTCLARPCTCAALLVFFFALACSPTPAAPSDAKSHGARLPPCPAPFSRISVPTRVEGQPRKIEPIVRIGLGGPDTLWMVGGSQSFGEHTIDDLLALNQSDTTQEVKIDYRETLNGRLFLHDPTRARARQIYGGLNFPGIAQAAAVSVVPPYDEHNASLFASYLSPASAPIASSAGRNELLASTVDLPSAEELETVTNHQAESADLGEPTAQLSEPAVADLSAGELRDLNPTWPRGRYSTSDGHTRFAYYDGRPLLLTRDSEGSIVVGMKTAHVQACAGKAGNNLQVQTDPKSERIDLFRLVTTGTNKGTWESLPWPTKAQPGPNVVPGTLHPLPKGGLATVLTDHGDISDGTLWLGGEASSSSTRLVVWPPASAGGYDPPIAKQIGTGADLVVAPEVGGSGDAGVNALWATYLMPTGKSSAVRVALSRFELTSKKTKNGLRWNLSKPSMTRSFTVTTGTALPKELAATPSALYLLDHGHRVCAYERLPHVPQKREWLEQSQASVCYLDGNAVAMPAATGSHVVAYFYNEQSVLLFELPSYPPLEEACPHPKGAAAAAEELKTRWRQEFADNKLLVMDAPTGVTRDEVTACEPPDTSDLACRQKKPLVMDCRQSWTFAEELLSAYKVLKLNEAVGGLRHLVRPEQTEVELCHRGRPPADLAALGQQQVGASVQRMNVDHIVDLSLGGTNPQTPRTVAEEPNLWVVPKALNEAWGSLLYRARRSLFDYKCVGTRFRHVAMRCRGIEYPSAS